LIQESGEDKDSGGSKTTARLATVSYPKQCHNIPSFQPKWSFVYPLHAIFDEFSVDVVRILCGFKFIP